MLWKLGYLRHQCCPACFLLQEIQAIYAIPSCFWSSCVVHMYRHMANCETLYQDFRNNAADVLTINPYYHNTYYWRVCSYCMLNSSVSIVWLLVKM